MYYRSTVLTDFLHLVVCNVYDEFGGKIGSVSLHWDSLNDLKVNVFSVTLSTWLFKDHPQGTKEPHRTPAWLSEIWPCVSVMKYQFIFGVCDGRQRLKTLYYLFQTSLCVLLPIYCSVTVLLFWKTNWIGSDQRLKRLYRVLISWTRATLTSAIKLLLCETGLYLSSGLGGMHLCWTEGTWTLSYVHTMQHLFIIVSSSYSTVKCSIRDTSTRIDVQSISQQKNVSSPVLLLSDVSWKSNEIWKCQ